ncbi:hypothetical protein ACIGXM_03420 [Kitasatospora sp. NPDC052896]|uniref:hypothetical protein n=1 Tax=Kitasatospora sp. NPDC052896 TaxID=3364061 RepID=UPI0037C999A4
MQRLTLLKRIVNTTAVAAVLVIGAAPAVTAAAATPHPTQRTSVLAAADRGGRFNCPRHFRCDDSSWGG